uniref:Uncharacterized protein n=1 Tax=Anguilla anguilla TaxID=7936 RepID=A0A0E9UZG0_ANGAN
MLNAQQKISTLLKGLPIDCIAYEVPSQTISQELSDEDKKLHAEITKILSCCPHRH